MQARTRDELLALTPDRYLRDGYLDAGGTLRPAVLDDYASAAAAQLIAADASPQELSLAFEGIRQLLPLQHGDGAAARLAPALEEALSVVAAAIQQANNPGLVRWITACAEAVHTDADLTAFVQHVQASLRQHALLAAFLPAPGEPLR